MTTQGLPDTDDPFELLGLGPDATPEAAKSAYVKLIKRFRPEKFPQEFRRIRAAYEAVLSELNGGPARRSPPLQKPAPAEEPAQKPRSTPEAREARPFRQVPTDERAAEPSGEREQQASERPFRLVHRDEVRPDRADLPLGDEREFRASPGSERLLELLEARAFEKLAQDPTLVLTELLRTHAREEAAAIWAAKAEVLALEGFAAAVVREASAPTYADLRHEFPEVARSIFGALSVLGWKSPREVRAYLAQAPIEQQEDHFFIDCCELSLRHHHHLNRARADELIPPPLERLLWAGPFGVDEIRRAAFELRALWFRNEARMIEQLTALERVVPELLDIAERYLEAAALPLRATNPARIDASLKQLEENLERRDKDLNIESVAIFAMWAGALGVACSVISAALKEWEALWWFGRVGVTALAVALFLTHVHQAREQRRVVTPFFVSRMRVGAGTIHEYLAVFEATGQARYPKVAEFVERMAGRGAAGVAARVLVFLASTLHAAPVSAQLVCTARQADDRKSQHRMA